jgi:hypothetical protein
MSARVWKQIGLVGLLLVVGWYTKEIYCYWRTDAVYEKLVAADPRTRAEVEILLTGFQGNRISEPALMQPILGEKVGREREYWRYTKYCGFPIDVVYESDGSVFTIWAQYE